MIEKSVSLWEDLGFSEQEAASLEVRCQLMGDIREMIRGHRWTQAAAAKKCGVSQPRINDLMRGKIDKFSIDALVNMVGALGKKVHIELRAA